MTSSELGLIKASLDELKPDFQTQSVLFYEALFRRAPELRAMFREDIAGQGMKFLTTLEAIVNKLDDPSGLASQYAGLGAVHASVGVRLSHFAPMKEALIETLRAAAGGTFSPELEAAWRKAFDEVGANMIRRGHIAGA